MKRMAILAAVLCAASAALAQTAATQPASAAPAASSGQTPAAAAPAAADVVVTIVSTKGPAEKGVLAEGQMKWSPLKAGDVLNELCFIRTGYGAEVVIQLGDRGQVTINSVTKMGVGQFRKEGNLAKASLGLKYGTFNAKVDHSQGPNDFRVATPTSVLSVRGSRFDGGHFGDEGSRGRSHESPLTLVTAGGSRTVNPGEHVTQTLQMPIVLLATQFHTQTGDSHVSQTELNNQLNNHGGRSDWNGGTPTNGNQQGVGSSFTPPPPPPSLQNQRDDRGTGGGGGADYRSAYP